MRSARFWPKYPHPSGVHPEANGGKRVSSGEEKRPTVAAQPALEKSSSQGTPPPSGSSAKVKLRFAPASQNSRGIVVMVSPLKPSPRAAEGFGRESTQADVEE